MNPRVLIIDNDLTSAGTLSTTLQLNGMDPSIATDGHEALALAQQAQPDLVILDVRPPWNDGWEICRRLKRVAGVPVLVMGSRAAESDVLGGFRAGADDYIVKPFGLGEITARAQALLRRANYAERPPTVVRVRDLELDPSQHRISRGGLPLDLTPKEYRLLAYLMRHAGQLVTHEELLTHVWGSQYSEERPYLMYYVRFLRKKLGDSATSPSYIRTVRGQGYRLVDQ